jgi:hypothetical protein
MDRHENCVRVLDASPWLGLPTRILSTILWLLSRAKKSLKARIGKCSLAPDPSSQ